MCEQQWKYWTRTLLVVQLTYWRCITAWKTNEENQLSDKGGSIKNDGYQQFFIHDLLCHHCSALRGSLQQILADKPMVGACMIPRATGKVNYTARAGQSGNQITSTMSQQPAGSKPCHSSCPHMPHIRNGVSSLVRINLASNFSNPPQPK